jgi:predicted HTH domain antitoxin
MQVTITLPDTYRLYANATSAARDVQLHHALALYKQGTLSLGKAAELAERDLMSFIAECRRFEIPTLVYDADDDVAEEVRFLRSLLPPPTGTVSVGERR